MSLAAASPLRLLKCLPIGARLAILAIVCAGLSMAASIYMTVRQADAELHRQGLARLDANMRVAWDVLGTRGSGFSVDGDKLLVGTHVLNGDSQTVDRVKTAVGGVATVFLGDLRIATNIVRPDGARAVGTKLAPGAVYDTLLRDNRAFRGPNILLGQP